MQATYRSEFVAALNLLARACGIVAAQGLPVPVLVGGAVVEFDTAGHLHSGDFDLVSNADEAFAQALLAVGFRREDRRGHLLRGFYHPDLSIGVEFVSGAYFDGHGDRSRIRVLAMPEGKILLAATEDLIADRLGQWVASNRRDDELFQDRKSVV